MTTQDVNVILLDFPNNQKEMVVSNEDGSYTILINAKLSHEAQLRAYNHALKHINDDDFKKMDVQEIETQAHRINVPLNAERIPADMFKKRILQLRRERSRIRQELEKKEREIAFLMEVNDPDWFFDVTEERWLCEP